MIPAAKSPTFTRWFTARARSRLQRSFGALVVHGLPRARAALDRGPCVIVSNHTAFFDPLVALVLCEGPLGAQALALMDAENLRRLPFFARVGGFGVDLDNPSDGAAAVRYAARWLTGPGRAVWVFPQGGERPITARPLGFAGGAAAIARVARAPTLPIALRYEQGDRRKPEILVSIGPALPSPMDVEALRRASEDAVVAQLRGIDRALCERDLAGFEAVLEAPAGEDLATRLLATFTRGRVPRAREGGRPGRR